MLDLVFTATLNGLNAFGLKNLEISYCDEGDCIFDLDEAYLTHTHAPVFKNNIINFLNDDNGYSSNNWETNSPLPLNSLTLRTFCRETSLLGGYGVGGKDIFFKRTIAIGKTSKITVRLNVII